MTDDIWLAALQANALHLVRTPSIARRPYPYDQDPADLAITFDQGVPVAIDGETVTLGEAVTELDRRSRDHAVPLRTALDAFIRTTQRSVSGDIHLTLHGGRVGTDLIECQMEELSA